MLLYREESESDEELEWRLLRAGDLDLGLKKEQLMIDEETLF